MAATREEELDEKEQSFTCVTNFEIVETMKIERNILILGIFTYYSWMMPRKVSFQDLLSRLMFDTWVECLSRYVSEWRDGVYHTTLSLSLSLKLKLRLELLLKFITLSHDWNYSKNKKFKSYWKGENQIVTQISNILGLH